MLAKIGARDIDALFRDVPKEAVVGRSAFDLPDHQGELEVERALAKLAAKNVAAGTVPFFCGAGAYRHHVPAAVDHLIQRSEFLTSYTPYQPEIAQGTLQYLFEFQTQVALLTGMEVANASLYDGSTANGEAVLMAQRITRRPKAILSGGLHPHYAETVGDCRVAVGRGRSRAGARRARAEDLAALIDDANGLRCGAEPGCVRARARSAAHRGSGACQRRAADCGRDGSRVAGPVGIAGRHGRGYRRGRRPVDRQRPQFRRALCRAVRHAREIPAPDAGTACAARRRMRTASAVLC